MEKDKKKTLTISSNLKKKIDTSSISSSTKKSYLVDKKKPFKNSKPTDNYYKKQESSFNPIKKKICLLYTSDAADE